MSLSTVCHNTLCQFHYHISVEQQHEETLPEQDGEDIRRQTAFTGLVAEVQQANATT